MDYAKFLYFSFSKIRHEKHIFESFGTRKNLLAYIFKDIGKA